MATEEKTINVVGMHCPSCVAAVELSIKDLDGVVAIYKIDQSVYKVNTFCVTNKN